MDLEPANTRPISGRDLRYVLTIMLWDSHTTLTIDEMIGSLAGLGLSARGRPSKTIADALRWEIARGRVRRAGRGRYRPGTIPTSTRWWLRKRADVVRDGGSVRAYEMELRLARL